MTREPAYLSVDLGGTVIKAGLVRGGRVVARRRADSRAGAGLRPQLPRLKALLVELAAEADLGVRDCNGLGLAFPTLVDGRAARLLSPMLDKYADVLDIDLPDWARNEIGIPLKLENDAHAALLGEWKFGAGRGCDDLVMVTLGTGIGSSVIIDGKPLRGRHAQAGVLGGHLVMTAGPNAPECGCGGRGCVEAESASAGTARYARSDPGFAASALSKEPTLDFAAIFNQAEAGDSLAVKVRDRSLSYWGAAVVSLIHCFDPARVIVGGGVMRSADTILAFLRQYIDERAWTPWGRVELNAAELGDDAALLGLSTLFGEREAVEK